MTKNNPTQQTNKHSHQQAYDKALRLLSIREHSQMELKKKLTFFSSAIVQSVLTQLQQQGYQSDERFTHSMVRSRIASGKGYQWIKQELNQHQISDDLISQYLDQIDAQHWQSYCYQAWQKKFARPVVNPKIQAMGFSNDNASERDEDYENYAESDEGDKDTLRSQENYQQRIKQCRKQQNFLSQRGFRPKDWQEFLGKF